LGFCFGTKFGCGVGFGLLGPRGGFGLFGRGLGVGVGMGLGEGLGEGLGLWPGSGVAVGLAR